MAKVVLLKEFKRIRLIHGPNSGYEKEQMGGTEGSQGKSQQGKVRLMPKPRPNPKVPHLAPDRKRKEKNLMIRLDDEQKQRIESMARAEHQSTANWARTALMRLTEGWQLVPPNWKVTPP